MPMLCRTRSEDGARSGDRAVPHLGMTWGCCNTSVDNLGISRITVDATLRRIHNGGNEDDASRTGQPDVPLARAAQMAGPGAGGVSGRWQGGCACRIPRDPAASPGSREAASPAGQPQGDRQGVPVTDGSGPGKSGRLRPRGYPGLLRVRRASRAARGVNAPRRSGPSQRSERRSRASWRVTGDVANRVRWRAPRAR